MTTQYLLSILDATLLNYNKPNDPNLVRLWKDLYLALDNDIFGQAVKRHIQTNTYFPNAAEILENYRAIKREREAARIEALKADNRLLAAAQEYCYLCENTGYCRYERNKYEFLARCVCVRGQDLNKFSESNIDKDYIPEEKHHYRDSEKKAIRAGKNPFYKPTIAEKLKGEEYALWEAGRKAAYYERYAQSGADIPQAMEYIKQMSETIAMTA